MYRLTDVLIPTIPLSAAAVGTLTSDETNVADEGVLVLGAITYRFMDTPAQAYDVQRGSDADESLSNLIAAINASGDPGTEYFAGTLIHPLVSASALASHATTITAKSLGFSGNDIVTTGLTHLTFAATTLGGGKGGSLVEAKIDASGDYVSDPIDVSSYSEAIAFLTSHDVVGATGTLDIKFQLSPDAVNWLDAGDAFAQVTTGEVTTMKKLTANFGRFIRAFVSLGGTAPEYKISLQVVGKN